MKLEKLVWFVSVNPVWQPTYIPINNYDSYNNKNNNANNNNENNNNDNNDTNNNHNNHNNNNHNNNNNDDNKTMDEINRVLLMFYHGFQLVTFIVISIL